MKSDLENIELFVRAASLLAIGKAGAEFGFSNTSASMRIKSLEADLGVELFYRTTRMVSLTSDGEVFLEYAKRVLGDLEEAKSVLSGEARSLRGTLRMTAPTSFARTHIVPHVPEFLRQHPKLKLDLNQSDRNIDIVEQGYDVAFRIGDLSPSSLMSQKLDDNPIWLVASPDYLEQHGMPKEPNDLAQHITIPFGQTRSWRLRGNDGSEHEVPVSGPVTVDLADSIRSWTLMGVGISAMALWHAGPEIKTNRLVRILPSFDFLPETKIWAVRPPTRVLPLRVDAGLAFFKARIKETNETAFGTLI